MGEREHKWLELPERRITDMITNRLPEDYELVRKSVAIRTGAGLTGPIRKRESHGRAATNFALHHSRAAVKIHDGFHQGQAQA
jgi:hypothetical protein